MDFVPFANVMNQPPTAQGFTTHAQVQGNQPHNANHRKDDARVGDFMGLGRGRCAHGRRRSDILAKILDDLPLGLGRPLQADGPLHPILHDDQGQAVIVGQKGFALKAPGFAPGCTISIALLRYCAMAA